MGLGRLAAGRGGRGAAARRAARRPATHRHWFVISDSPSTAMPACAATITSGTVDMPTASPPSRRMAAISEGDSYVGPLSCRYTPERRKGARPRAAATRAATACRLGA